MSVVARDDLFAADLNLWAETQARALQEGRFGDLDRTHLAAVLDRLGADLRREVRARLGVILTGLLRWSEQVDLRSHGWAVTLSHQRRDVADLLDENPSLQGSMPTLIAEIYPSAKRRAVLESGLFDDTFSEGCPFTETEILAPDFYPDPYGDDAIRGEGWWMRRP